MSPGTGASVQLDRQGRVASVAMGAPPANMLGAQARAALAALDEIEAAEEIAAVVLHGGGADGNGFEPVPEAVSEEADPAVPSLGELCDRIESFSKPVVACLEGTVVGNALALALAAHWRLAAASANFGFPEIDFGLVPQAGATQRAPRLIGAAAALELMLEGRPIGASAAQRAGLIDGVLEVDPLRAAQRLAAELADKGTGLRPSRARSEGMADPSAYLEVVERRRQALAGARVPAGAQIVDCIEAALLLPFGEGLAFERAAAASSRDSAESRALIHARRAERRAAKAPELVLGRARPLGRTGIVGAGALGEAITLAALDAGLAVVLVAPDAAAGAAALERIEAGYLDRVEAGLLEAEAAVRRLAALKVTADWAVLAGSDAAILAISAASPELERAALHGLEAKFARNALLARAGGGPGFEALAEVAARPERMVGLDFGPAELAGRVVEVSVGRQTEVDAVATAFAFVRRLGRVALRTTAEGGGIGRRVSEACRAAMETLLAAGAGVEEVDAALRIAGLPLGPFEAADLIGLDQLGPSPLKRPGLGEQLRAAGRLGRAAGRGYYRYDAGGEAEIDPEVSAMLAEERARSGIEPREVAVEEIVRKAFAAMAGEGARLVAEGTALRPSDVDAALLFGQDFPRWLGGPMQWADEQGLLGLRDDLRRWAEDEPRLWQPVPLWDDLIKNGRRFGDLGV